MGLLPISRSDSPFFQRCLLFFTFTLNMVSISVSRLSIILFTFPLIVCVSIYILHKYLQVSYELINLSTLSLFEGVVVFPNGTYRFLPLASVLNVFVCFYFAYWPSSSLSLVILLFSVCVLSTRLVHLVIILFVLKCYHIMKEFIATQYGTNAFYSLYYCFIDS